MIGIRAAGIQAPMANLETTTTVSTTPVAKAPTALMTAPSCQPRSRRRQWWTTIPVWERVNPVNTPTA